MKVVCETCGTKYSIDDNRVSGKAFKIRCKKCNGVISLRGAPVPVTEPVPEVGAWHAVLGGTQVGPLALDELHRLRATGGLDDGSMVWREGFDDWRALGTVEELREVAPPSVVVAPEAADAQGPARPALRSERNETSVLFTLGNLAKLAAPAPASAASATRSEGSGLLDIRSLARSLTPAHGPGPARGERGSLDDLPSYTPVAFVEPTVMVPGAPHGRDRRLAWALAATLGMLAIVATVLVMVVVRDVAPAHAAVMPAPLPATPARASTSPAPVIAQAAPAPVAPAIAQAAPTPAAPAIAQAAPAQAAPAPTIAQAAPAPAIAQAALAPAIAQAAPAPVAPPTRREPAAPRRAARAPATPVTPRATPAIAPPLPLQPQPTHAADACSEVSCLVNGNTDKCCEIYRDHAGTTAAPAQQLPDSLDRQALGVGIARIDTSGCHDQSPAHGDVTVSIKVSPAGAVTTVTVKSSPAPELGACVTAAARKATFARTQRGGSFAYVWRF